MSDNETIKRWWAEITYRTENGSESKAHEFEELVALHDIVEYGPDWNTIIDIRIVLRRSTDDEMTLESSGGFPILMPPGNKARH